MENVSITKPLLLIGIFILTVIIVVILFFRNDETPVEVTPEPVAPEVTLNQQEIIPVTSVLSKSGTRLTTRDFLEDEDVELIDESAEVYRIASEQGPDGSLFEIFYFKGGGGGLNVSLLDPDLTFARNRAETVLQEKLELSLLELCALQVSVTVPRSVSPFLTGEDYSGINLGLPSCPGAIVF